MVKVPLPLNASTKRYHKTQALMGATRPASGIKAKAHKHKSSALITCLSVNLCFNADNAGRVAPISGSVLCLRLVVAGPLPYYNNFTCRVSYILH